MSDLRRIGREAEDRAADYLIEKGYTIVTRRFSTRNGEIDIVALDGETLVFVEVKHRRAKDHVPEEAFGQKKSARIIRAVKEYIDQVRSDRATRIDLIAMDADGLRHYLGLE